MKTGINILVEGIDGVGKSTLCKALAKNFFHLSPLYINSVGAPATRAAEAMSKEYYKNLFSVLEDPTKTCICDRSHLGEMVYSPMYRGYSGEYVLDLEYKLCSKPTLLVWLDNSDVQAVVNREDGDSLSGGSFNKVVSERMLFLEAFSRSTLKKIHVDACNKSAAVVLDEVLFQWAMGDFA